MQVKQGEVKYKTKKPIRLFNTTPLHIISREVEPNAEVCDILRLVKLSAAAEFYILVRFLFAVLEYSFK